MNTRGVSMKNRTIYAAFVALIVIIVGIAIWQQRAPTTQNASSTNEVGEQTVGDYTQTMSEEAANQLADELGAFEITATQRELAKNNKAGYAPLDAGRGNPNWINSKARYAYTRLMDFANAECQLNMSEGDMAGHGEAEGIAERFNASMDPNDDVDKFLLDAVAYCEKELGLNREELLMELTNGIIGDYYPSPSRCLTCTEAILNDYLQSTLYDGVDLKDQTEVFPTEGGSAAMSYIFHSLSHNKVLKPGDTIAIATPIFTPYLQIPEVNNYGLVSVNVSASQDTDWDIPEEELAKLEDTNVKALFLVNPSNPASHALSDATLDRLEKVVDKNPNLIILTDDVYGTFVDDFQTVYSRLPHNTILVYSYSKLYGATGWRVGLIAMHKNNVVDRLISELPEDEAAALNDEYDIVTTDPASLKFIDRMTADSRSIGLYHTSGLATPAQVFMDVLSLTHLVNKNDDPYIAQSKQLVNARYEAFMKALGITPDDTRENAQYYTLVDINALIEQRYNKDFANWKKETVSDIDFLNDLAQEKGVVLMYGPGFDAPEGCVRVSLANLNEKDYVEIARRILELLDEYHEVYQEKTALDQAA